MAPPDSVPMTSLVSPPQQDPNNVYPQIPELEHLNFDLTKPLLQGSGDVQDRLLTWGGFQQYLLRQHTNFMGFQASQSIEGVDEIAEYLKMHINNIGDAFMEGNCTVNSKVMERAVLDYYASLWNAKWPNDPKDGETFWGFLLTMGSTEGNMYALWNARDYLSGKVALLESCPSGARLVYRQAEAPPTRQCGMNCFTPVAFYSEDTHYSFAKASQLIQLPLFSQVGIERYPGECPITEDGSWPSEVPSLDEGVIDIEKLQKLVEFFAAREHPIFVSLNYGSTFKGAYDDVKQAIDTLLPVFAKYDLFEREITVIVDGQLQTSMRTGYWIHVDGALGAAYMPYLKMAIDKGMTFKDGTPLEDGPEFDFRLGIHSIALSGHKWMGATGPCGIYMSKHKYQMRPPSNPIYIGTPDTTFAGSRNGLAPLFFWYYLSKLTLDEQIERVLNCFEMVRYIEKSLKDLGEELELDLWVARSTAALTVRFKQLNANLVHKYSLSNESLVENGELRLYSHVFAMAHVTTEVVDSLIQDIRSGGADSFEDQNAKAEARRFAKLPVPTAAGVASISIPFEGRGFSGCF